MSKAPIRELLFGRLALAEKLVTDEQLTECLGLQLRYGEYGGKVPLLGELLTMKGYLSAEQVRAILEGQRSRRDGLFGEIAMRWRLIDAGGLERALDIQRGMDAAGKPRAAVGEILVDLGLLRPSQVRVILGAQGKRIVGCPGCRAHFNVVRYRAGARLSCPRCSAALALGEPATGAAEDLPLGVVGTLWCPPEDGARPAKQVPSSAPSPAPAAPAAPARPAASAARSAAGADDLVEIREDVAGGFYFVDPAETSGPEADAALKIGGYEIIERLGSDAASAVCKARRLAGGDLVVLKVFWPPHRPDEKTLRAFQENGRKAVYLDHPNLKRVFEVGLDHGRLFLAEEFIEGQSLKRQLDLVGRMLASDAMDLARQLAEALSYGHERGIVHGDVRPSNVIIDQHGAARLAGLGVAKDAVLNLRYLGRDASNIPFYLAPEVAVDPARAEARSDIYSLGAVLYHMLTGRPPYSGSGSLELLMRLAREPLVAPEQIDPKLPPELCRLVKAMLTSEPDERPANMAKVIAKLRELAHNLAPVKLAAEARRSAPVDGESPTQASEASPVRAPKAEAAAKPKPAPRPAPKLEPKPAAKPAPKPRKYRRRRRYGP